MVGRSDYAERTGSWGYEPPPPACVSPSNSSSGRKKERKRCTWIGLHTLPREQHGATDF